VRSGSSNGSTEPDLSHEPVLAVRFMRPAAGPTKILTIRENYLYLRSHDQPGVIGHVGTTLGKLGVNIATFALGRREANLGAEAVSLVCLDGKVTESILAPILEFKAVRSGSAGLVRS
jgi:hypothetical protein